MKKLITILFIALSVNAISQTIEKFAEGYKYGFRDKATKKVIVPAKYTATLDFLDGITAVTESAPASANMIVERKWKIIDTKGKDISQDEFNLVEIKKNGIAFVYKLNKTENNPSGYINGKAVYKIGIMKKDGTYLYPCELYKIIEMGDEYFKMYSNENGYGVFSAKGYVVIPPQLKFDIREYIGCDLFSYSNKDANRYGAYLNGVIGGIIDSKLNIVMNQDSINFCPSRIINPKDCSNKKNLFGLTGGKSSQKGIYRVGVGLIVPQQQSLNNILTFEVKPNIIEVYQTYQGKRLIAKYDWTGKSLFSIDK